MSNGKLPTGKGDILSLIHCIIAGGKNGIQSWPSKFLASKPEQWIRLVLFGGSGVNLDGWETGGGESGSTGTAADTDGMGGWDF